MARQTNLSTLVDVQNAASYQQRLALKGHRLPYGVSAIADALGKTSNQGWIKKKILEAITRGLLVEEPNSQDLRIWNPQTREQDRESEALYLETLTGPVTSLQALERHVKKHKPENMAVPTLSQDLVTVELVALRKDLEALKKQVAALSKKPPQEPSALLEVAPPPTPQEEPPTAVEDAPHPLQALWDARESKDFDPAHPWHLLGKQGLLDTDYTPSRNTQAIWFPLGTEHPLRELFFPPSLQAPPPPPPPPPPPAREVVFQRDRLNDPPKLVTQFSAEEKWDQARRKVAPAKPNPPPWCKGHDPKQAWFDPTLQQSIRPSDTTYPEWDSLQEQYVRKPQHTLWPSYRSDKLLRGWDWEVVRNPLAPNGWGVTRHSIPNNELVDPFNKPEYAPWSPTEDMYPEAYRLKNRPRTE